MAKKGEPRSLQVSYAVYALPVLLPARPLGARPLAVYSFVMSVNSFVTGWPRFSRRIHYPVNDREGLATCAEKLGHPVTHE
jgi:hypothetical protein